MTMIYSKEAAMATNHSEAAAVTPNYLNDLYKLSEAMTNYLCHQIRSGFTLYLK